MAQHAELAELAPQRLQPLDRAIPAGVVYEDDLVSIIRKGLGDLAREGCNRALLVEDRNDDGQLDRIGRRWPGRVVEGSPALHSGIHAHR